MFQRTSYYERPLSLGTKNFKNLDVLLLALDDGSWNATESKFHFPSVFRPAGTGKVVPKLRIAIPRTSRSCGSRTISRKLSPGSNHCRETNVEPLQSGALSNPDAAATTGLAQQIRFAYCCASERRITMKTVFYKIIYTLVSSLGAVAAVLPLEYSCDGA